MIHLFLCLGSIHKLRACCYSQHRSLSFRSAWVSFLIKGSASKKSNSQRLSLDTGKDATKEDDLFWIAKSPKTPTQVHHI